VNLSHRISGSVTPSAKRRCGCSASVDEYGERAARASAAKTRGELNALFADLPQPHPQLDRFGAAPPGGVYIQPQPLQRELAAMREPEPRPVAQRIGGALVPLSGILALVLFFGAHTSWLVFLLPAAIAVITGALWGEDQRKQKHKVKYKDRD
jgi:hypothetical protein